MTLAKIVYASMTGNTEGISEILEDAFEAKDIDVERVEADDADDDFFDDADICVVATYTYNDGEIPFDFEDFHDSLSDQDLNGKTFGVVGSGDSELYPDFFCKAAELFEEAFNETGAKEGAKLVKVENAADDADTDNLKKFVDDLIAAAK